MGDAEAADAAAAAVAAAAASSSALDFASDANALLGISSPRHDRGGATLGGAEAIAAATAAAAAAAAAAGGPAAKKPRTAETKKEKERRLNRVGLSYRCGRCGMPKKGHVCTGVNTEGEGIEGIDEGAASAAMALAGVTPPNTKAPAPSKDSTPNSGDFLNPDSIFNDIRHVLQTPKEAAASGGEKGGKANGEKKKGGGKEVARRAPPPSPARCSSAAAGRAASREGSAAGGA